MKKKCAYCGKPIGNENWSGIYVNGRDMVFHHPDDEEKIDCYSMASRVIA